ncbi:hypothetical protein O6P43_027736 [Quillaja saponaria]|nr:hypothetical protein O6P43_027736 [Quillaja saponaria]
MVSMLSLGGAVAALHILNTRRSKPWRCAAYVVLTWTAAEVARDGFLLIYRATAAYDQGVEAKKNKMEGSSKPTKDLGGV